MKNFKIPKEGIDRSSLLQSMEKMKKEEGDVDWQQGRSWSLVYYADEEHTEFLKKVYAEFFSENGVSPTAFPSLRRFEAEVVEMILHLLGGQEGEAGTMTSGGTESILLAIKTYRDWARKHKPNVKRPEILVPESAHPAFLKAAQYFDLKIVFLPVTSEFRSDIHAIEKKITDQTICIVGSAPSYPQGVIDPIWEMGEIAQKHGIGFHVDACLGGFLLPFMRKLGYSVRDFDFKVPGVSSISADLHKNGYAAKGASVILYKTNELRGFQYFISTDWPGGLYGSPTMMGTRPGGAIASAWAAMMAFGENGYLELARRTLKAVETLVQGVEQISELNFLVKPDMNILTIGAKSVDIFSVADKMEKKGWRIDRQRRPESIHLIVTPNHEQAVQPFLKDFNDAVEEEKRNPTQRQEQSEAMLYGVTGKSFSSGRSRKNLATKYG